MRDVLRLLGLFRPYRNWIAAGVALSVTVILSNVALLALSGWFIASMAIAGLGTQMIDTFAPAAAIRGLAILRTGARYLERLVTHEATFRLLSELRVWFYRHLEPLAPARLQAYRGGDLLSRIRADIDSLEKFYLRDPRAGDLGRRGRRPGRGGDRARRSEGRPDRRRRAGPGRGRASAGSPCGSVAVPASA